MRATADLSALAPAVDFVARTAKPRDAIVVLGFLRIEVTDGRIALEANNLARAARASCEAADCEDGAVAVPATALSRFCRFAPKGSRVSLALIDGRLTVEAGKASASFPTLPTDDFPKYRSDTPDAKEIDAAAFCLALSSANVAASTEESRFTLNVVYLDGDTMVATSGARMHIFSIPTASGALIPREHVPDICALLKGGGEFGADQTAWVARAAGRELVGGCVDGVYPDYKRATRTPELSALVGRDDLLSALNAATLGTGCPIKLKAAGDLLSLTGAPSERGWGPGGEKASAEVSADIKHDSETGINGEHLRDALNVMPDAEIALSICDSTDASGGLVIEPADGSAFLSRKAVLSGYRL